MLEDAEFQATIPAQDLVESRRFYEETLGCGVQTEAVAGITYLSGKGTSFFLYQTPYAGTAKHTLATWWVPDVNAAVRDLRGRGVEFEEYDLPGVRTVDGVADLGSERTAWFRDPSGNVLAISELVEGAGAAK